MIDIFSFFSPNGKKKKKRKKKLAGIPGSETSAKRRGTNTLGNMPSRYTTYSQVSGLFVYGPLQDHRRYLFLPAERCFQIQRTSHIYPSNIKGF